MLGWIALDGRSADVVSFEFVVDDSAMDPGLLAGAQVFA
jgi:hypothetical protein